MTQLLCQLDNFVNDKMRKIGVGRKRLLVLSVAHTIHHAQLATVEQGVLERIHGVKRSKKHLVFVNGDCPR